MFISIFLIKSKYVCTKAVYCFIQIVKQSYKIKNYLSIRTILKEKGKFMKALELLKSQEQLLLDSATQGKKTKVLAAKSPFN